MTHVSKLALAGCLAIWAAGILFGTRYANNYSSTAGRTVAPLSHWPETALTVSQSVPTLVVAIHPQCPCSGATAEQLHLAIDRSGEHPKVYALVLLPPSAAADWMNTPVVRAIRELPGAQIVIDRNGAEIDKFHARVSGEVFLYDTSGNLRFHGGVTGGRGHQGANVGTDAVLALLRHSKPPATHTPVFGCSLRDERAATGGD